MNSIMAFGLIVFLSVSALAITPVAADTFTFSTGSPDGRMGTASRPDSPGKIEIESADDFVTTSTTRINQATFTGLLTGGAGLVQHQSGQCRNVSRVPKRLKYCTNQRAADIQQRPSPDEGQLAFGYSVRDPWKCDWKLDVHDDAS